MKTLRSFGLAALLALSLTSLCAADGLDNHPTPPEGVVNRMRLAAQQFLINGGDLAQARPDLFLLVDDNPATDFTAFIAPVLRDTTTYNGIADTLEEDYGKADAKTKPFVLYNLAHVHELRAKTLPKGAARAAYLDAARKTIARFDKTFQDPGLWELKGDIESDAGNTDAAVAAYKKIAYTGTGTPPLSLFKTAQAYQDAGQTNTAEAAYKSAARADAVMGTSGGKSTKHAIYQGLLSLYLQKGDYAQAAVALAESVRVKQETPPFYLRGDLAYELLRRGGNAQSVLDYANAVLALTPSDEAMTALRDLAQSKVKSQAPPRSR